MPARGASATIMRTKKVFRDAEWVMVRGFLPSPSIESMRLAMTGRLYTFGRAVCVIRECRLLPHDPGRDGDIDLGAHPEGRPDHRDRKRDRGRRRRDAPAGRLAHDPE